MRRQVQLGCAVVLAACSAEVGSSHSTTQAGHALSHPFSWNEAGASIVPGAPIPYDLRYLRENHFTRIAVQVTNDCATPYGDLAALFNQAHAADLYAGVWMQAGSNPEGDASCAAQILNTLQAQGTPADFYTIAAEAEYAHNYGFSQRFVSQLNSRLSPAVAGTPKALATNCGNPMDYPSWRAGGFLDVFPEAYWNIQPDGRAFDWTPFNCMNFSTQSGYDKAHNHVMLLGQASATPHSWQEQAQSIDQFEKTSSGRYGGFDLWQAGLLPLAQINQFYPLIEQEWLTTAPPCSNGCPPGSPTQCTSGTTWQGCGDAGNYCTAWGPSTECPSSLPTCSGGTCSCTSTCSSPGSTECTGATTYRGCLDMGNGCYQWSAPVACPYPTTSCYYGNCTVAEMSVQMTSAWLDYGYTGVVSSGVSPGGGVWSDPSAPLITGQWDGVAPWGTVQGSVRSYGSLNTRVDLYSWWGACTTGYAETGYTPAGGGTSAWSPSLITSAWNGSGYFSCLQARIWSSFRQCKLALVAESRPDCTGGPVYANSWDGAWSAPLLTSDIEPWGCLRFQLQCL
jgi:hypothetical protein